MIWWSEGRTVLAAATMAFFVMMAARLAISPVVPAITAEFQVSTGEVGLALSGMWLAYALAQFPSGLLGDRIGERRVILIAVVGTAVASLFLALSPVFAAFLVWTVVLGAAAGLHFSVAITLLSRRFRNTGTAVGIHNAGAPIAGVVVPVAAAYLWELFGWRYAVALGAVTAVPALVLVAAGLPVRAPARPDQPIRERVRPGILFELLARPPIAGTLVVSVLSAFVWQGTSSFLPTFLIEHRGYSVPTAGAVFSGYFLVQGAGQPIMGWLSDRIGRNAAMSVCMATGVAGYTLFVLGPGLVSVVAATVLVGVAMSWGATMLPKFLDNMSPDEEGMGIGLVRTTYMVFGASGSVGVGLLADQFGWAHTFLILAGVLGAVLLFVGGSALRRRSLRSLRVSLGAGRYGQNQD